MVAKGAEKNEATVAENSLCSGKKKMAKKFPHSTTQLFSLTNFVLILLILTFGPLLFLIYVSDICDVSKELEFILFADDTNFFLSHKNLNFLIQKANFELIKLTSWFQANRLSNIKKTKYMIFKPRQKGQTPDHLTVKLCDYT